MSKNKYNILLFSFITFLFIVLPVFSVFCGCVYYNILKIKTDDINIAIKKELQGKTLNEKKEELKAIEKNISYYVNKNIDYNKYINDLDSQIKTLNKKKEETINNINIKVQKKEEAQIKKTTLEKKYKAVSNHQIKNIITINQYPNYPNGCEAVALTILLNYYNINVSVKDVIDALPIGKTLYYENGVLYGGNPNYEFLGNPSNSSGWGIWDKGLANTANKFKPEIINGTGTDFNNIIKLVKNNRPVIVWTSINLANPYIFKTWIYKPTGEVITWKNYNHAVVVMGYTEDSVIVSDPINGKIRSFNKQKFINVYNYMGKKAIYY